MSINYVNHSNPWSRLSQVLTALQPPEEPRDRSHPEHGLAANASTPREVSELTTQDEIHDELNNFIQTLNEAEQSLRNEFFAGSMERSDFHRLLMNVCERSIFPSLLQCTPETQKLLLGTLDQWLEHLQTVVSSKQSNSIPASVGPDEWTIDTIRAFTEFLRDYRKAMESHGQPWKGRAVSAIPPEEMDRRIAYSLCSADTSRQQILERLAEELLISADLDPSKAFCESAARLLQQMIESALHSSLPTDLMQKVLEDKTLNEGMSYKEAAVSNESMPPEMLDALVKMANQLINLGNPDVGIRSAKFYFLHGSIVRVIGRVVSHFATPNTQEPDIASFALHLLCKYSAQGPGSASLSPEELSQKLTARIFEMAVLDKVCSRLARMSISAFQEYSPLLNVPATANEMGKQIFLLLQRPETMSAFIYGYLLKKVLIPKLTEQNAAKKAMKANGAPPQPVHPFLHQVGQETSAFLALFLRDYVYSPLIKDSPVTRLALAAVQEGILTYLPNSMATSLVAGTSPKEQRMYCDLLDATSHFLEDFIVARQAVNQLIPGRMGTYRRTGRNVAIHREMNRMRMVRGMPLLKREDKERKLKSLTKHLLQGSQLTSEQKLALEKILPSLLETIITQISPPLLHQILLSMLSPNQGFEKAPLSGLSNAWEPEIVERWNQNMIQLIGSSVRLSEIDNVASTTAIALMQQLLDIGGKEIASLVSTPSPLFDPAGQLNLIRQLKACLWKEGPDGRLIPSTGLVYNLSRAQKQELSNAVTQLIRSKALPIDLIPPFASQWTDNIKKVADNFTQTMIELIENPTLLETFIYQYVIEDTFLPSPSDPLNSGGLHFELSPNAKPGVQQALESPNLSLWMSQLQEWQSMGLPSSVRSIQDVIAYLSQNNHLKPDDTAFLYSLVDKEESALAAQYIDYALHRPRGQNNSLECVSSEQLVADFVQRSIGILISPFLMAGIAQTSHLTEEARLCHAVEKALELSIDGNNTPHSQLLSDMLDSLRKSPTPLLFLSRFLSGIRQIKYWQNTIETMHRTKGADLFAFYQAFSEATPHLLGSPFTLRQRAILSSQLQGPLKAASWGEALRIPTDWRGPMSVHVCRDSVEGIQQKFQLLQKAKNSVVLSGSYFGGAPLSEALSIIREKLRTNPKFNAYILGSEYMLKPENHAEFQGLKNAYPDRFHLVLNHEVNPFTNPYTGRFFLMCNHVKLLVIDEGTDFLIGGSGIEERWANHDGIKDIDPGNLSTGEPLAFRDADYVFHSESPNGLGKLLHHKLLELCAHCCYMKNEDLAKRYFDPRFYPISKTNEAVATLPPTGPQTQAHIEFFATNPEEAVSNGFEQRLIQLIENAQKRIVIDHMYFHPTEALLQSLIRASNRDVSILLITNQDQPNTPGTHKLFVPRSRYMWKQLFEGKRKTNVCIFEYLVPYTTLHKKVMLIDNCVATGSANCGLLSMEGLNHEYNVIVHSETVAGQTMDLIEADIDQSRLVPDEEAMTISLAERRSGIATAPLQYFF